jgi:alkylated DNA nucleotide flippase Atl1
MRVNNTTLNGLIEGQKQFRIPIWQRQYTWRTDEHHQLWRDLLEQYAALVDNAADRSTHFLGSFVLAPVDPMASGVTSFLVIDGQQRLTTLMLALCALRDVAAAETPGAIEEYNETYLINKFREGDAWYRLRPTEEDRAAFFACVRRETTGTETDAISKAYRFFRAKIENPSAEYEPLDLSVLRRVIVERLAIVEIATQQGDNPHRIFQSLNGTGVRLAEADLLRNYLFMLLPSRAEHVYDQVWRPMEQLIGVENLESLARVDLQRRGLQVKIEDVYDEHQKRLAPLEHDEDAIEEQLRDFALRAKHYKRLIDPQSEPDAEIRAGLERLGRWGPQTSRPLLMVAYDLRERDLLSLEDMRRVVAYVESFLLRRQLARIPTNALNRLFIQLIDHLPEEGFADALHRELSRDRLYWPSDDWLRKALRTQPFFHIGRWQQRKLVLERLEESFEHPERIDFGESELQIEHVLPQTLTDEWREHLRELGQEPDLVHAELVHTLGNLTLTAFNGALSNHPFERKQQIYGSSHLELNRALVENDAWGRDEILARADTLAEQAIKIWVAPLPGITSEGVDRFNWSRIEEAIVAIPYGRWTTYGDLAELDGTAAQPVGNHVREMPSDTNAYRVLTADGSVSSSFRWSDPNDPRDVLEVLAGEGIAFDPDGRADPEKRISTEELIALIDTPEDEVLEDEPALEDVA